METVGPHGELIDHFDGRTLNPGHAIEGAWFIMREGKLRGDRGTDPHGLHMLDWMWKRGWDQKYGGILYFVDVQGLPVQEYWHDMKFWWPQNETIIATLLAYQSDRRPEVRPWHAYAMTGPTSISPIQSMGNGTATCIEMVASVPSSKGVYGRARFTCHACNGCVGNC